MIEKYGLEDVVEMMIVLGIVFIIIFSFLSKGQK
jgi:hypothetical protein